MKITMYWHGGSSYGPPDLHSAKDAEQFDSLKSAKLAFWRRADFDPYYPCVADCTPEDGGPEALIFKGANVVGQECPDYIMRMGRRGGVILERA